MGVNEFYLKINDQFEIGLLTWPKLDIRELERRKSSEIVQNAW